MTLCSVAKYLRKHTLYIPVSCEGGGAHGNTDNEGIACPDIWGTLPSALRYSGGIEDTQGLQPTTHACLFVR